MLMPTRLLQATLADFLPTGFTPAKIPRSHLPPGYHLAYFPNPTRLSTLLPDGTDPTQSPGPPFNRRMWAGGQMTFSTDRIRLVGRPCHCTEKITDVQIKGQGVDQKIFVQVARNVFPGRLPDDPEEQKTTKGDIKSVVEEFRTLVFMHDDRQAVTADTLKPPKILKPTQTPDFSHTLVPTPALLFRFSALTFNAHAIHLDKQYCRETEGHRNLLVHGPLCLVFMLEVLRGYLRKVNRQRSDSKSERIFYIEYRNMAPLYAEEEMKVCIKLKDKDEAQGTWDVWIEGKDGGYAVKALVKTSLQDLFEMQTGYYGNIYMKFIGAEKKALARKSAAGKIPALKKESALVDEIPTGDETVTDEAAFQKEMASVTEIPTGNEMVPDFESASQGEGAPETERPAEEETEEDSAPYYQR